VSFGAQFTVLGTYLHCYQGDSEKKKKKKVIKGESS
jgi:hypothetical protein